MSQMATARALPRLSAQGLPSPRELRVVVGAPKGHAGLVASCLLLLTAGLVAVLLRARGPRIRRPARERPAWPVRPP